MPTISVTTGSGETEYTRSQDIIINVAISNELRVFCPTAKSFNYLWSVELLNENFAGMIPASWSSLNPNTRVLKIVKNALIAFPLGTFDARVNVTMVHPDGELTSSASLSITLLSSDLVVRTSGGNARSASINSPLILDSTSSYDQDGTIQ